MEAYYSKDINTMGFFLSCKDKFIYPETYDSRDYERNIVETSLLNNTWINIPHGSGNSFIANVVISNFRRWYPASKVVFLAPTQDALDTQHDICLEIELSSIDISQKSKDIGSSSNKKVIFALPSDFEKHLKTSSMDVASIKCIIIDNIFINDPYYKSCCEIVEHLKKQECKFRTIILSYGFNRQARDDQLVVDKFNISRIEQRNDTSNDLAMYLSPWQASVSYYSCTTTAVNLKTEFTKILEVYLRRLKNARVLMGNVCDLTTKTLVQRKLSLERSTTLLSANLKESLLFDFDVCIALWSTWKEFLNCDLKQSHSTIQRILQRLSGKLWHDEGLTNFTKKLSDIIKDPQHTDYHHPKCVLFRKIVEDHLKTWHASTDKKILVVCSEFDYNTFSLDMLKGLVERNAIIKSPTAALNRHLSDPKIKMVITWKPQLIHDIRSVDLFVVIEKFPAFHTIIDRAKYFGRKGGKAYLIIDQEHSMSYNDYLKKRKHPQLISPCKMSTNSPRMIPEGVTPEIQVVNLSNIDGKHKKTKKSNSPEVEIVKQPEPKKEEEGNSSEVQIVKQTELEGNDNNVEKDVTPEPEVQIVKQTKPKRKPGKAKKDVTPEPEVQIVKQTKPKRKPRKAKNENAETLHSSTGMQTRLWTTAKLMRVPNDVTVSSDVASSCAAENGRYKSFGTSLKCENMGTTSAECKMREKRHFENNELTRDGRNMESMRFIHEIHENWKDTSDTIKLRNIIDDLLDLYDARSGVKLLENIVEGTKVGDLKYMNSDIIIATIETYLKSFEDKYNSHNASNDIGVQIKENDASFDNGHDKIIDENLEVFSFDLDSQQEADTLSYCVNVVNNEMLSMCKDGLEDELRSQLKHLDDQSDDNTQNENTATTTAVINNKDNTSSTVVNLENSQSNLFVNQLEERAVIGVCSMNMENSETSPTTEKNKTYQQKVPVKKCVKPPERKYVKPEWAKDFLHLEADVSENVVSEDESSGCSEPTNLIDDNSLSEEDTSFIHLQSTRSTPSRLTELMDKRFPRRWSVNENSFTEGFNESYLYDSFVVPNDSPVTDMTESDGSEPIENVEVDKADKMEITDNFNIKRKKVVKDKRGRSKSYDKSNKLFDTSSPLRKKPKKLWHESQTP